MSDIEMGDEEYAQEEYEEDNAEEEDVHQEGDEVENVEEDDIYQEETTTSWCDRLGGAIGGICIGILLFFGSFPLLFWNEGRAVQRYDALNEGEAITKSISSNYTDPSNEGSLVHFTATIQSSSNLTDPIFGVSTVDGEMKLRRDTEMYQWKENRRSEKKKKTGGGTKTVTTYSYSKGWESTVIDSSSFKRTSGHENPGYMRFEQAEFIADDIRLGAFTLPQDAINRVNWYTPITEVDKDDILDESIVNMTKEYYGNTFYYGENPQSPSVGDTKVGFRSVLPTTITIVAQQNGDSLISFRTKEGGSVFLFKQGSYSMEEMYDQAEQENKATTWILRFVGFFVMAFGLYLVMRPIEVFADVLPCVGDIIGCGITFVAGIIAAFFSGLTISIAWLIYHPVIGAIVLVVIVAIIGLIVFVRKMVQNKQEEGKELDEENGLELGTKNEDIDVEIEEE